MSRPINETHYIGKTVVLTGASSGIGRAAADILASQGCRVIICCRTLEKSLGVAAELESLYSGSLTIPLAADLSSIAGVQNLVAEIRAVVQNSDRPVIDALINNAASVSTWYRPTEDGYETQFMVNHLAAFILTNGLFDLIAGSASGRIVTVSSGSHRRTRMHWSDVMFRRGYNILSAYKQSKLANVLFTAELNRIHASQNNVQAFAADPGLVNTEIGRKHSGGLVSAFWKFRSSRGRSPREAAQTIVFLALDPTPKVSRGIYWKNCQPIQPSSEALKPEEAARLWELSLRLTSGVIEAAV